MGCNQPKYSYNFLTNEQKQALDEIKDFMIETSHINKDFDTRVEKISKLIIEKSDDLYAKYNQSLSLANEHVYKAIIKILDDLVYN